MQLCRRQHSGIAPPLFAHPRRPGVSRLKVGAYLPHLRWLACLAATPVPRLVDLLSRLTFSRLSSAAFTLDARSAGAVQLCPLRQALCHEVGPQSPHQDVRAGHRSPPWGDERTCLAPYRQPALGRCPCLSCAYYGRRSESFDVLLHTFCRRALRFSASAARCSARPKGSVIFVCVLSLGLAEICVILSLYLLVFPG